MRRTLALTLLAAVLVFGGASCGGDDGSDEGVGVPTATETTGDEGGGDEGAAGGELFASAGCASCHTFTRAGATGTVGPNLDETTFDAAAAANQIRNGGGGMPAFEDQLSDDEIEQLAEYVTGAGS